MNLIPSDLATHEALGITPAMLERAQIRRVDDNTARDVLSSRRGGDLSGILYPYIHPITGCVVTHRLRRDHPEMENGKHKNKYLSPFGDRKHLYFVPGCRDLLSDVAVDVIVVEAEKSGLSVMCAADLIGRVVLPVALGGCWGWRSPRIGKTTDASGAHVDEAGPLPDLDLFVWTGRTVILIFDANVTTSPTVKTARRHLAQELTARGATVRVVDLPVVDGVNGPDDYIGRMGAAPFFSLLDDARTLDETALDAAILDLNTRHALLFLQSGGMVVLTEDEEDGQSLLRFSRPHDMALLYPTAMQIGKTTRGAPVTKALGSVWLTSPRRRFYRGIEVAPNGRGNAGYYNMWRGFSVEPKAGTYPALHRTSRSRREPQRGARHVHPELDGGNRAASEPPDRGGPRAQRETRHGKNLVCEVVRITVRGPLPTSR